MTDVAHRNGGPARPDVATSIVGSTRAPLLDVRGLEVGYLTEAGTVVAVHDVSFALGRGEILGIAGESGSGKSTVAHAVARLIDPPGIILEGSVWYHRHGVQRLAGSAPSAAGEPEPVDILGLSPEVLRALRWDQLAIVFQSAMNALNPVLSIEAQILDAIAAHRPLTSKREARARAREMLQLVGIPPDRSRSFPHELSGGMRQRVTIAMALTLQPDLVILDEPTTGLDVIVQRSILERLLALRAELDFSVIFITHDLSLLLEICDSVMVMYAGRMVEIGSAASLYRRPLHPYSQRLLDAFPALVGPRHRLEGIPGSPPDPSRPVSGCPFHPRCDRVFGPCADVFPELLTVGEQRVRCHLYDQSLAAPFSPVPEATAHRPSVPALRKAADEASVADQVPVAPLLEGRRLVRNFRLQRGRRRIVHAVEDVSLSVRAGSISAIVGESGSGKSTLLRLLALLDTPTSGELLLDGDRITRTMVGPYRSRVQLVFQDPFASMNPTRTVGYHLERPLRLHWAAMGRSARRERAHQLLERVSLVPAQRFVDRYPHELSGGQRQRVMIARALAVGPSVLLADEPVSMLDVSMQVDILNLLSDLATADGLGMVYVTHNITSARYLADTISVMYAGSLVEAGPASAVADEPAHPYTQLLLRSVPRPESRFGPPAGPEPSEDDAGEPPALAALPTGCRFHPRCPSAMAVCSQLAPPPVQVGADHWATCWLLAPEERARSDDLATLPIPVALRRPSRSSAEPPPLGLAPEQFPSRKPPLA